MYINNPKSAENLSAILYQPETINPVGSHANPPVREHICRRTRYFPEALPPAVFHR
jgi:hypothetical protein